MTLVVRTSSKPLDADASLRRLVSGITREAAVSDVKTLEAYVSDSVATPASTTWLLVLFAGLALALGSIGVYGVISFLVSKRTHEIGIRLALGARRRDISWLILKQGAKVCAIGLVCGIGGALTISRALATELYGVSPIDPLTYCGVALIVTLVAFVACYVPMRRAMRVDPLVALHD